MIGYLETVYVVEVYSVGLSALMLTPIMVTQAIFGSWAGWGTYGRLACWGGVALVASVTLIHAASRL